MPRVRDIAWATTTVATGTTIQLRIPSFEQNDLLVAGITSDTGPSVWTGALPSGWNQLFDATNTAQLAVFWKIASASEADPTFTRAAIESFNGAIVSIEDVNITNPFGSPQRFVSESQASAAKYLLSRVTCSVANSLVLHFVANSAVGVPSLIEGSVYGLLGADGVAESMGAGWSFMPTSGSISGLASASNVAAGAGMKCAIQIAAPASGAVIIPTYTPYDNSIYLDPINGTTAFNGNTALAATADTNFGTTLAGITANDATVAASGDAGINSFHSVGQLTSATTANAMSGAELVFSAGNRPDLSNKNFLIHAAPSTTGQFQRLTSIKSSRGLWVGMRGASPLHKIWQVYGQELGVGQFHQPIVIHPQASGSVTSSGAFSSSSVNAIGMWVGTNTTVAAVYRFYQMWGLDTVGVAGGNAIYPVTIDGIVDAVANGHERKSALVQGKNQMLVLQPIEIGNGGTSSVYLKLDATAIEFPTLYNKTTRAVTYNSIPNFAGLTYYPGPTDIIIHKNSVVSSLSPYKWGFHPSASISASYDFDGLAVIGAGNINLNRNISVTGLSITDYDNIDARGLRLYNGIISQPPTSSNSITVTGSNVFDECTINVSTVSASNYWVSTTTPEIFSNTTFVGSGSSGHAFRLTQTGSYTLNNLTFTGFGSGSSVSASIFNDSAGAVTMSIAGAGTLNPSVRNGTSATTLIVAGQVTVTLTGLVVGTEIRILATGTATELAASDNTTELTSEFAFTLTQGTIVDIVIHHVDYEYLRVDAYTIPAADASIPISQRFDRNYSNPV